MRSIKVNDVLYMENAISYIKKTESKEGASFALSIGLLDGHYVIVDGEQAQSVWNYFCKREISSCKYK